MSGQHVSALRKKPVGWWPVCQLESSKHTGGSMVDSIPSLASGDHFFVHVRMLPYDFVSMLWISTLRLLLNSSHSGSSL